MEVLRLVTDFRRMPHYSTLLSPCSKTMANIFWWIRWKIYAWNHLEKIRKRDHPYFFVGRQTFFRQRVKMSCKTQWFDAWMAINNVLLATPHISLFGKNQSSDKLNRSGQNSNNLGLTTSANWISLLFKNADAFRIWLAFFVFALRKNIRIFMKVTHPSSYFPMICNPYFRATNFLCWICGRGAVLLVRSIDGIDVWPFDKNTHRLKVLYEAHWASI